jgi:hypothetical protein
MAKASFLCGWCASAPLSANGVEWSHAHCRSPEGAECACGVVDHKFDGPLATRIAAYCHIDLDEVYRRHGRKRRVVTEEQREAMRLQLKKNLDSTVTV